MAFRNESVKTGLGGRNVEWKVRPPSSRDAAMPVEAVATANPPRARQCFSMRLRVKVFPAPPEAYKKEGVGGVALPATAAFTAVMQLLYASHCSRLVRSCVSPAATSARSPSRAAAESMLPSPMSTALRFIAASYR